MKYFHKIRFELLESRTVLAGHGDFNGDGFDDLAIGIHNESVGALARAGAVQIVYGGSKGLKAAGNQFWTQNSPGVNGVPAQDDLFGAALAIGDFNGDDFDDLAIGVPFKTVSGRARAGAVNVLYGSGGGLTAQNDQLWTQDSPGINDSAENDDRFGVTLAAGDFNGDGRDDLAIGVTSEDVGTITDAGGANVIYGSDSGLTNSSDQFWSQNSSGINDPSEVADFFGSVLTTGNFNGDERDDLAIGVREDHGTIQNAGGVNVIYGSGSGLTSSGDQFWTQESSGVADTAETSDFFGDALVAGDFNGNGFDDLAIGARGENGFTGVVHMLDGSAAKLSSAGVVFNQSTLGFAVVAGSNFGSALAAGDFDRDGFDDLAVGAHTEAVSSQGGAGAVYVVDGAAGGLTFVGAQRWIQGTGPSGTLPGAPQLNDNFGVALATGDFDGDGRNDLAIAVPREIVGGVFAAGAVHVLYGFLSGLVAQDNQLWDQSLLNSSDGNEFADEIGRALA